MHQETFSHSGADGFASLLSTRHKVYSPAFLSPTLEPTQSRPFSLLPSAEVTGSVTISDIPLVGFTIYSLEMKPDFFKRYAPSSTQYRLRGIRELRDFKLFTLRQRAKIQSTEVIYSRLQSASESGIEPSSQSPDASFNAPSCIHLTETAFCPFVGKSGVNTGGTGEGQIWGLQVGRASPPSMRGPPCRLRSATWKPAPNSDVGPAFCLGTLNAGSSPKDTFLNLTVSEPPSSAVLYVPATCCFFKSLEANPWLSWQEHFPFFLSCSSSLPTKLFNNSESA